MDDPLLSVLPAALTYLYEEGKSGDWADVRTTAESVLTLVACGESIQSSNLTYAADYLLTNFKIENQGGSWGSELWDTSLVVMALHRLAPKGTSNIEKAFEWIWSKQLSDGSFDGEPWDTLFVCLAALEAGKSDQILESLSWLVSLQSPRGSFISTYYTGLFCEVIGRALEAEIPSELRSSLHQAAIRALHFLWDNFDGNALWTNGTWTNAYILSGFLSLRHPQILSRYDEIADWYRRRQLESGAWDDCVRTAIVARALVDLALAYELERCNKKSLQLLTVDFLLKTTKSEVLQKIQTKVSKAPVVRHRKLIERDESKNLIITLTPEREMYIGIAVSISAGVWWVVANWNLVKRLLIR